MLYFFKFPITNLSYSFGWILVWINMLFFKKKGTTHLPLSTLVLPPIFKKIWNTYQIINLMVKNKTTSTPLYLSHILLCFVSNFLSLQHHRGQIKDLPKHAMERRKLQLLAEAQVHKAMMQSTRTVLSLFWWRMDLLNFNDSKKSNL